MHILVRVKEKFHQMTVVKQMMIAITLIVFFSFTAITVFNYQRTIDIINRQQSDSNLEILDLKKNNYVSYMNQLEDYTMQLRYNDQIFNIINSGKPIDYSAYSTVSSLLRNTFLSRNDVVSYQFYLLKSKTCFSISSSDFNVRSFPFGSADEIYLYRQTYAAKGNYLTFRTEYGDGKKFLTICRLYINISNRRPLAFVKITVDDSFCRNLSSDSSGVQGILGIIDQDGKLAFSSDGNVLNTNSLPLVASALSGKNSKGSCSVQLSGEEYLAVFSDTANGRWKLIRLLPQDVLRQPVVNTRNISLLLVLVAFIISAGVIYALIRAQLRPLQMLAKQMQNVGRGDFKTKVQGGGSAEVNNLAEQFNRMTEQIDELIQKNYVAELHEKIAQMKALEAQVDPHFLYNTLQTISTEAVLSGQKTIQRMVESLASLLRYSVREKDLVPVRTELKHVRQYLFLQTARFEDRLAYSIDADKALEEQMIPKISILSLVENSIKHGLENSCELISIAVQVRTSNDFLRITVTDNGKGMTEERLAEVRSMTELDNAEGSSIGLPNLAARLKILYDGRASLLISSTPGTGTRVDLMIPLSQKGGASCIDR
ncbi:sensor histidine kinase [[Clostridium] cellulosi]